MKPGRGFRKFLLFCVFALMVMAIVLAAFHKTPWVVPEAEKARKNPLSYSVSNIAAARQIYDDKCVNCHGDTGKGDGSEAMMYDPPPADLTDAHETAKTTDGEIFYQITEGKKPMPSFKKRFTEEQRWQMVFLVRSFAQPPTPEPTPVQATAPDKKSSPHP